MNAMTNFSQAARSVRSPVQIEDAVNYLRSIGQRAMAMSAALDHAAQTAPEPFRSYSVAWAGTAENIADQAQAAEAELDTQDDDIASATIKELIAAHSTAWARYEEVCHLEDSIATGREPTPAERDAIAQASERLETALRDLCAHKCNGRDERRRKADYLSSEQMTEQMEGEPELIRLVLQSFV